MAALITTSPGQTVVSAEASWPTDRRNSIRAKLPIRYDGQQTIRLGMETAKRKRSSPAIGNETSAKAEKTSGGLRFFVVDHPDQLKDKKQMRQNRQHVMHTWLDKEAQNPYSQDVRVQKQKSRLAQGSDGDCLSDATFTTASRDSTGLSTEESEGSIYSSQSSHHDCKGLARRIGTSVSGSNHLVARRQIPMRHAACDIPMVDGIGGRFDNTAYMHTTPGDVPFSLSSQQIGGIDRFNTWPAFDDPTLSLDELKFSCNQRFGSKKITEHWVPAMLRARHAFLSSLCISSAHDDIMRRNLLPHDQKTNQSLTKRLQVRQSVIEMINESMNDPEMRVADETILAILHVLNSEIMGCDDRSMRIHQTGLHQMVRERGGLHNLGVAGQLAPALTIAMYVLANLRETIPHQDYVDFALQLDTKIPPDVIKLPENPAYSRPTGFQMLTKVLLPGSKTLGLLNLARGLTTESIRESTGNEVRSGESRGKVLHLRDEIFFAEPGWELDFDDMNERYIYESIRLVLIVYAQAISRRIPFSKAAAELGNRKTRPAAVTLPDNRTPIPILIKNALMRTDTSHCWDHLIGVLFWVSLVAGAAANPGPLANEERVGDDEDARKWITAINVRCCITLNFEFGYAVMETVKQMIAVQSLLHAGKDSTAKQKPTTWTEVDSEIDSLGP